jgi:hypothetical protein
MRLPDPSATQCEKYFRTERDLFHNRTVLLRHETTPSSAPLATFSSSTASEEPSSTESQSHSFSPSISLRPTSAVAASISPEAGALTNGYPEAAVASVSAAPVAEAEASPGGNQDNAAALPDVQDASLCSLADYADGAWDIHADEPPPSCYAAGLGPVDAVRRRKRRRRRSARRGSKPLPRRFALGQVQETSNRQV